jgi:hypothetical protein
MRSLQKGFRIELADQKEDEKERNDNLLPRDAGLTSFLWSTDERPISESRKIISREFWT